MIKKKKETPLPFLPDTTLVPKRARERSAYLYRHDPTCSTNDVAFAATPPDVLRAEAGVALFSPPFFFLGNRTELVSRGCGIPERGGRLRSALGTALLLATEGQRRL